MTAKTLVVACGKTARVKLHTARKRHVRRTHFCALNADFTTSTRSTSPQCASRQRLTCRFATGLDLGVEDNELGADLAGALSLEERDEASEVLEVERVVPAGRLLAVSDHRAVQPLLRRWRHTHELAQLERVRDVALQTTPEI